MIDTLLGLIKVIDMSASDGSFDITNEVDAENYFDHMIHIHWALMMLF